jgi:hypothetical protein
VDSLESIPQSLNELTSRVKAIEVEQGGLKHEIGEAMGIINNGIHISLENSDNNHIYFQTN